MHSPVQKPNTGALLIRCDLPALRFLRLFAQRSARCNLKQQLST